jgi:hypothetical protein
MLNVLMLSVIMPGVVAPFLGPAYQSNLGFTFRLEARRWLH